MNQGEPEINLNSVVLSGRGCMECRSIFFIGLANYLFKAKSIYDKIRQRVPGPMTVGYLWGAFASMWWVILLDLMIYFLLTWAEDLLGARCILSKRLLQVPDQRTVWIDTQGGKHRTRNRVRRPPRQPFETFLPGGGLSGGGGASGSWGPEEGLKDPLFGLDISKEPDIPSNYRGQDPRARDFIPTNRQIVAADSAPDHSLNWSEDKWNY